MRIDPRIAAQVAATTARPNRPVGASGTFRLGADTPEGAAAARSAAPLHSLDALLMLQGAEEDGRERRRRSARRGQDLLEALDGLKAALLSGTVPIAELRRLSDRLAVAAAPSGDAGLDDTIAAIELRSRVELAKLGLS